MKIRRGFTRSIQKQEEPNQMLLPISSGTKSEKVTKEELYGWFTSCADVVFQALELGRSPYVQSVLIVYCKGLCDSSQINVTVVPHLQRMFQREIASIEELNHTRLLWMMPVEKEQDLQNEITERIFSGELLLFFEKWGVLYHIPIDNHPQRNPEEPNTEISLKGPKDGFVEDLDVNVALIRKRLRTTSLHYESFTVGKRSQTKIALLFVRDIASSQVIEEVRRRLHSIDIDGVIGTTQLEEVLSESTFSLFPLFLYTGRPDFAMDSLLRGRFVLVVDGAPTVITGPVTLAYVLKTAEDAHTPFYFVSFERILRFVGLCIALGLPAFWIALVSYHFDQIPFTLLASISVSRQGIPLPAPLEMFLVLFLFELFREAGARLPIAIGQTLSVIGGLIIGQAAISAGFTAPAILVVSAASIVATFTLVHQSITATVSLLRFILLFVTSVFGLFGFFVSLFIVLIYLANLQSFGIPYMSPVSPPIFKEMIPALLKKRWSKTGRRPQTMNSMDPTRKGDHS